MRSAAIVGGLSDETAGRIAMQRLGIYNIGDPSRV